MDEEEEIVKSKPLMSSAARAAAAPLVQTGKLMISNLGEDVTSDDMKELFADFGVVKSAGVHCDETGKSLGMAHVEFTNEKHAIKAMKQYNGVPLDNKPMKIEFIAVAGTAPAREMHQTVERPRVVHEPRQSFKEAFQPREYRQPAAYAAPREFSRGRDDRFGGGGGGGRSLRGRGGGGRASRGGGGGGRGARAERPKVDLDVQLAKYQSLGKSDE